MSHTDAFDSVHEEIHSIEDRLFEISHRAADAGAKVIVWSEGVSMRAKPGEDTLIERGRAFAQERGVYFLLSFAAFHPGEVTPGRKFLENKVLTIAPTGEVLNTFFKNIPVSNVEPSIPGDGTVPIVATEHGKLSPSICYDADFPAHMRQIGQQAAEVLLLPAGDWYHIAPYHSYMAVTRGIENGCSVFRPTGHGTSVASDPFGRILAEHNFFADPGGILLADVPVRHVPTLYARIGDLFAGICGGFVLVLVLVETFRALLRRRASCRVAGLPLADPGLSH